MNPEVLDELVSEYALSRGLLTKAHLPDAMAVELSGQDQSVSAVEELINQGAIPDAMDAIHSLDPTFAEDGRLIFALHKQTFVELLRSGKAGSIEEALRFSRDTLAPFALHSYLDAYNHFKTSLLSLVFHAGMPDSPIEETWALSARADLAFQVGVRLRYKLRCPGPRLPNILRHLALAVSDYHIQAGTEPQTTLLSDLLTGESHPSMGPAEGARSNNVQDSEVQQLMAGAALTRTQALRALVLTDGALGPALLNELPRLDVNDHALDDYAMEYLHARGHLKPDVIARWRAAPSATGIGRLEPDDAVSRYRRLVSVRAAALECDSEAVIAGAEDLVPGFWASSAGLRYRLNRAQFLDAVEAGDGKTALSIIQSGLNPALETNPSLHDEVKATLAIAAFPGLEFPARNPGLFPALSAGRLAAMAEDLYSALLEAHGILEPPLLATLRWATADYAQWAASRSLGSAIAAAIGLAALQTVSSPASRVVASPNRPPTRPSGYAADQVDSVMSLLGVPHEEALHLLDAYDGNIQAIAAVYFG